MVGGEPQAHGLFLFVSGFWLFPEEFGRGCSRRPKLFLLIVLCSSCHLDFSCINSGRSPSLPPPCLVEEVFVFQLVSLLGPMTANPGLSFFRVLRFYFVPFQGFTVLFRPFSGDLLQAGGRLRRRLARPERQGSGKRKLHSPGRQGLLPGAQDGGRRPGRYQGLDIGGVGRAQAQDVPAVPSGLGQRNGEVRSFHVCSYRHSADQRRILIGSVSYKMYYQINCTYLHVFTKRRFRRTAAPHSEAIACVSPGSPTPTLILFHSFCSCSLHAPARSRNWSQTVGIPSNFSMTWRVLRWSSLVFFFGILLRVIVRLLTKKIVRKKHVLRNFPNVTSWGRCRDRVFFYP